MRRNKVLASIVLAASALTSMAGHAQDRGPRDDHGRPGMERDRHDGRDDHRPPGLDGRGHWQRGERVPAEYRQRQYVVDDWRGHRLAAPPRGQQWVAVGGDYFLIGVATGVVASAIFAH